MPRIRTIKPAFFQDQKLADVSVTHRLLFIGLWTLADREGRLEDKPRQIKVALFPYDDVNIEALLTDLAKGRDSLIVRYSRAGHRYIWVRKFRDHQRPHNNELESTFPPPNTSTREKVDHASEKVDHASEKVDHASEKVTSTSSGKENRKGKDLRKGRDQTETQLAPLAPSPSALTEMWNAECDGLPRCVELTDKRKRMATQRLRDRTLEEWREIIQRVRASSFCQGENERGWRASFDWLLQPDVGTKVLEGKYDNRPRLQASSSRTGRSTDAAREYLRGQLRNEDIEVVNANPRLGTKG